LTYHSLRAVIACHGSLTPPFQYIAELRKYREKNVRSILLLGAGLVAKPALEYLCRNPTFNKVTVGKQQDLCFSICIDTFFYS
jgi:alpha-aminoadipic semialdehyde synthase